MVAPDSLDKIFDADRALRKHEASLLAEHPADELSALLSIAVKEAGALTDRTEATLRLERLADLCAQVPGPKMADALIAILNDEAPSVRVAAGEAIRDVGYERYAEVARAIERALESDLAGPAMQELPWVLAEIGEPSASPLIRRFLAHPEAEVVAGAIEALVQLGDPDAIDALQGLCSDTRPVLIDDAEEPATIGELATEAVAAFDEWNDKTSVD